MGSVGKVKLVRMPSFDKAYHRLGSVEQKHTIDFLHILQLDPESNGLNVKMPEGAKDRRVRTARVNDNFRAVMMRDGMTFYLVTVMAHNKAYAYAEGLVFDINKVTGGIEMLDIGTLEQSVGASTGSNGGGGGNGGGGASAGRPAEEPGLFAGISDADLQRLGVNPVLIPALRELRSVDALLGVCELLPKLACDVLLALADGHSPEEVWERIVAAESADSPVDTADYEAAQARPATQETFVVSEDAEELEQSLLRPFSEWRIFLHPTQRALAYRAKPYNGPVRVTGGPGTGKTVVAVHRVRALADRLPPEQARGTRPRILLTTFTTTLAEQLQSLLKDLGGQELLDQVAVRNIDKIASSVVGLPGTTTALPDDKLRARWEELLAEQPAELAARWDPRFLHGEWTHVALAQGIETREEYFAARRIGRGRRINRAERAEIWSLIEAFERRLEQDRVIGFKQLAARAARIAEGGIDPRHQYAHIVVDEAQDLHAAHWRLLRALTPPGPDDLFITGDTHQRIYENKVTLGSLGIDIRGRSHKLTLNYRTTRQILDAAARMLGTERFDDLDGGSDDLAGYRSVLTGRNAEISGYADQNAEFAALGERVREWMANGVAAADIVVVARTGWMREAAADALEGAGIPTVRIGAGAKAPAGERVHVMTMHRIKGLEYRAVAVIGAGARQLPQPSAVTPEAVDPVQHAQDLRAERSLLFVSATRAREHLAVTWHGEPSPFLGTGPA